MFIVVNASGKFWDGLGWNVKGREFCSVARATRSLYEHGEDLDNKLIVSPELINHSEVS